MSFGSAEDRLNPVAPEGADESTLGGYMAVYGRSAAFEGTDGEPYTVGIEAEQAAEGAHPWVGYLVFLRWSATGSAIMGHVETEDLAGGATEAHVRAALEGLTLHEVRALLDETIRRKQLDEDA
ncbi:MAG TPA: hypothetical protein VFE05_09710 [Longimicrobiaceae bacterium]|jgi:hypothetical protein|nr:hypothetical protein [Longimicrobiaceae bacterium]